VAVREQTATDHASDRARSVNDEPHRLREVTQPLESWDIGTSLDAQVACDGCTARRI
jgi:hypothetical protein